jgi:predicted nucleic acid-binding protein
VAERPAVNASPLIFLAQGDLLDFLKLAGSEIVIPAPVAKEIQRRGVIDPTAQALTRTAWLIIVEAPPVPALIQAWDLGEGESSVLAWAYTHPGTEVIVDDLAARRCAAALGLPVRGTLGLVLTANGAASFQPRAPLWSGYAKRACICLTMSCNRRLR